MPRTQLMEKRAYDAEDLDLPVVCPAGERIEETPEGPACRCRIEDSIVSAARDASSMAIFCTGEHELCPTWRVARETEWQHLPVASVIAPSGLRRNYQVEDLLEMEERRAAGDAAGANRIGERINESRREQGLRDVSKG